MRSATTFISSAPPIRGPSWTCSSPRTGTNLSRHPQTKLSGYSIPSPASASRGSKVRRCFHSLTLMALFNLSGMDYAVAARFWAKTIKEITAKCSVIWIDHAKPLAILTQKSDLPISLNVLSLTGTLFISGHTGFVNSVSPVQSSKGPPLVASASDDCSVKIWDCRRKNPCSNLNSTYQVTAVTFRDSAEQLVSAGIDNVVKIWDLRKGQFPKDSCRALESEWTSIRAFVVFRPHPWIQTSPSFRLEFSHIYLSQKNDEKF